MLQYMLLYGYMVIDLKLLLCIMHLESVFRWRLSVFKVLLELEFKEDSINQEQCSRV